MAFNFRSSAPADGSITTAKLADGAVSTIKIAPNAVDSTKVTIDLATEHFLGSEVSLPLLGTTETTVGDFNFLTGATSGNNWKKLSYQMNLASSVGTNTASAKIYIDSVQYGTTQSTTNTSPTLFGQSDIDISSLTAGSHHLEVKLVNSSVSATATLTQLDIYLGKQ